MPTKQKAEIIEKIKHEFENAEAVFLVDYKGLTVKQAEGLRNELRGLNAEMKVYKNTLARIALSELEMPTMEDLLVGPTAFVVAFQDPAAPAKVVKKFAAANKGTITVKGGLVSGQVVNADEVNAIAELPSREELIAKLLGTLQNPVAQFVRVLQGPAGAFARVVNAIAEQKDAA